MKARSSGYCSAVVIKADGTRKQLALLKDNVLTNNGRDWMKDQVYKNTAAGTRGSGFVAVTESTITPGPTDTALTGEISTNGLARADATTKTNSAGTNAMVIEHTFTVTSGSFTSVLASALFNASSGVTMTHIANFSTGSGTLAVNDTLKVTWTLNLG